MMGAELSRRSPADVEQDTMQILVENDRQYRPVLREGLADDVLRVRFDSYPDPNVRTALESYAEIVRAAFAFEYHPDGPQEVPAAPLTTQLYQAMHREFFNRLYVRRKDVERRVLSRAQRPEVVVLAGERGTGKSTIISKVLRVTMRFDLVGYLHHVDFEVSHNEAFPESVAIEEVDSRTILDFIYNNFRKEVVESGRYGSALEFRAYLLGYTDHFSRMREDVEHLIEIGEREWDPLWVEIAADLRVDANHKFAELEARYDSTHPRLKIEHLLRYLIDVHDERVAFVLDNIDHLSIRTQAELVTAAIFTKRALFGNYLPVICIREEGRELVREDLRKIHVQEFDMVEMESGESVDSYFDDSTDSVTAPTVDLIREIIGKRLRYANEFYLQHSNQDDKALHDLARFLGFASARDFLEEHTAAVMEFFVDADNARAALTDLVKWHNGSLRNVAVDLTEAIAAVCGGLSGGPDYASFLRRVPTMEREIRSMIFRRQVLNRSQRTRGSVVSPGVLLFDVRFPAASGARVAFPRLRVLQYMTSRGRADAEDLTVRQVSSALAQVGIDAHAVREALFDLSAPRDDAGDTGLIRIAQGRPAGPADLLDEWRVRPLSSAAFLRRRLSATAEFMLWSALKGRNDTLAAAVRSVIPGWKPGSIVDLTDGISPEFRSTVATNYFVYYVAFYDLLPFRDHLRDWFSGVKSPLNDQTAEFACRYRRVFGPRLISRGIVTMMRKHVSLDLAAQGQEETFEMSVRPMYDAVEKLVAEVEHKLESVY